MKGGHFPLSVKAMVVKLGSGVPPGVREESEGGRHTLNVINLKDNSQVMLEFLPSQSFFIF